MIQNLLIQNDLKITEYLVSQSTIQRIYLALPTYLSCPANVFILPCQSLHLSFIRTKLSYLDMRTFEKTAARKEQELLFTLQPKRKLQAKQKVIWTINTKDVRYECIAIGRRPNGIEVEEWSNSSELSPIALQGQG